MTALIFSFHRLLIAAHSQPGFRAIATFGNVQPVSRKTKSNCAGTKNQRFWFCVKFGSSKSMFQRDVDMERLTRPHSKASSAFQILRRRLRHEFFRRYYL